MDQNKRHKEFIQFLGFCAALDIDFASILNDCKNDDNQELSEETEESIRNEEKQMKKTYPN